MAGVGGVPLVLLAVLALQSSGAVKVQNRHMQMNFYQRAERAQQQQQQQEVGEFMMDFDGDEMFYVDLDKKETVWRLPEFGKFTSFQAQRGLQNVAIAKQNMDIMAKWFNRSQGATAPPEMAVFSVDPVELGDPNVLICFVDKFWPSVISITWQKNGQKVTDGIYESVFYSLPDHSFRKFSYLTFIPTRGDFYDCHVQHEAKTLTKHWEPQVPLPVSESTQTLVCALGLAVGIVGIIVGIILVIKAKQMNGTRTQRGVL